MSSTEQAPEPTMDEILASIRRIIADDDTKPSDGQEAATDLLADDDAGVDDILDLTREIEQPANGPEAAAAAPTTELDPGLLEPATPPPPPEAARAAQPAPTPPKVTVNVSPPRPAAMPQPANEQATPPPPAPPVAPQATSAEPPVPPQAPPSAPQATPAEPPAPPRDAPSSAMQPEDIASALSDTGAAPKPPAEESRQSVVADVIEAVNSVAALAPAKAPGPAASEPPPAPATASPNGLAGMLSDEDDDIVALESVEAPPPVDPPAESIEESPEPDMDLDIKADLLAAVEAPEKVADEPEPETSAAAAAEPSASAPEPEIPEFVSPEPAPAESPSSEPVSPQLASLDIPTPEPAPREAPSPDSSALDPEPSSDMDLPAPVADVGSGSEGEKSLETSVREMLRPMLREWLDDNMPRILESAVKDELSGTGARKDRD